MLFLFFKKGKLDENAVDIIQAVNLADAKEIAREVVVGDPDKAPKSIFEDLGENEAEVSVDGEVYVLSRVRLWNRTTLRERDKEPII